MTCIRCKSCGVTPGKTWDLTWNHDEDLCPDCTLLHNKGRICKKEGICCIQGSHCLKKVNKTTDQLLGANPPSAV